MKQNIQRYSFFITIKNPTAYVAPTSGLKLLTYFLTVKNYDTNESTYSITTLLCG